MPKIDFSRVQIEDYDESDELLENIQSGRRRSTCGALVLKVNDYVKKPAIEHDLTGILSAYLAVLQNSDVCIKSGFFNVNFAEAALLLQGSVQLYGKKVDLLWDFVIDYLHRNMSYEEKTEENKEQFDMLKERQAMFKSKRRMVLKHNEQQSVQNKSFVVNEKSASIQGMCFEEFQHFINDSPTSSECNINSSYNANWINRTSKSKNTIVECSVQHGNKVPPQDSEEQYFVTNLDSIMTYGPVTPIQHDLTEMNIYNEKEPMGDYGSSSVFDRIGRESTAQHRQVHRHSIPQAQIARHDVQDHVLQQWLQEKSMRIDQVYAQWGAFTAHCIQAEEHFYKLVTKSTKTGESLCYYQPPKNSNKLEALCDDMQTDESIELSTLDQSTSNVDRSIMSCYSLENEIHTEFEDVVGRRKTTDSDIESGVFDTFTSSVKGINSVESSMSVASDGIGIDSRGGSPLLLGISIVEEVTSERCKRAIKPIMTFQDAAFGEMDVEDKVIKSRKRKRPVKEKERPVITTELKAFDKFFRQHYTPDKGEGEVEPLEDEPDDDSEEPLGDLPELDDSMLETSIKTTNSQCVESSLNITQKSDCVENDAASQEELPELSSVTLQQKSFAEIMGNDAALRLKHVLDWRKFITEKIGNQTKSDFDIHAEETQVIDSIGKIGMSIKFKKLCAGKTAADVSHNFIALLHLANTHNVEISGIQDRKLSDDTLEIKLLSTDRHHEHLDEYNAYNLHTLETKEKVTHVGKAIKRQNSDAERWQHSTKRAKGKN